MKAGFATMWGHGIDKERDIRKVRSDARVLSSGPTQILAMRDVL